MQGQVVTIQTKYDKKSLPYMLELNPLETDRVFP